ncbi:MAG: DUF3306 domain-containing protein [Paracoccaceae bacterium]|nr:DUF3306 domain-containing protein [Paracoccaceae bacterium]
MTDREEREGGFLRNWSRRKLAAKRETPVVAEEPAKPAELPDPIQAEEPVDTQAIIDSLPSLDEITAGFDMKPFMAKGVPAHLKNAALRKMWLVNPAVRDYADPAVDYAWDWNAPGGVPGGGGVLSGQSVEKMVKDLIGERTEPEYADAEATVPEETVRPRKVAQVTSAEETLDPVAPQRDEDSDSPDPAVAENPVTEDESPRQDRVVLASQRRHGGAVPE